MRLCEANDHVFKRTNVITRTECKHVQSYTLDCKKCDRVENVKFSCGCKEDNAKRKK